MTNKVIFILIGVVDLYYATKLLSDRGFAEKFIKGSATSRVPLIYRKLSPVEAKTLLNFIALLGILLGISFILYGVLFS